MKDFLLRNKRTVLATGLLLALYAASKFPALAAEKELLEQLWALLAIGTIGAVPQFTRKPKDE